MTLQPVDGLLGTLVDLAKQDPVAASELLRLGLYESLVDQVAAARPQLERDTLEWMEDRTARARSEMLRSGVAKALDGDEDEPVDAEIAGYLAGLSDYVSKGIGESLVGAALALFNRQHPHGQDGRFVSANTGAGTTATDIPTRISSRAQEGHAIVQNWKRNNLVDDSGTVMGHYRRIGSNGQPGSSNIKVSHPVGTFKESVDAHTSANPDHMLMQVSMDRRAIPVDNNRQRATLDALATFTGANNAAAMAPVVRKIPSEKPNLTQQARDWNTPTDDDRTNGDRQTYRRLSLTGAALASASPRGSAPNTIGEIARTIGDLGPEAERVLAPGIRRTAYRYRGTERRPDRSTVEQIEQGHSNAEELSEAAGEGRTTKLAMLARQVAQQRGGNRDPVIGVTQHYAATGTTLGQDQLELGIQGDLAVNALASQVVSPKLAQISMAAGELPPSQGIIIDADGNVVSHAQGYNGDHYLPFDLRNLGELHGGQYVRTRAAGGPTTEDVYTALMTGTRQLQVISNSGVYTVEFDPDMRGGRRYSDKAQRMIGRYGKLLAAIEGGDIYEQPLNPGKMAELRRTAYEQTGWDKVKGEARFKELTDRAKLEGGLSQENDDELTEHARKDVMATSAKETAAGRPMSSQQIAQAIEDRKYELQGTDRDSQVRAMVLDGTGYRNALQTLMQEFPFYIRSVDYQTVPDFFESRHLDAPRQFSTTGRGRDKGYVERGQTNPKGLSHGRTVPTGRRSDVPAVEPDAAAVAAAAAVATAGAASTVVRPGTATTPAASAASTAQGSANQILTGKVRMPLVDGTKPLAAHAQSGSRTVRQLSSALQRTAPLLNENPDIITTVNPANMEPEEAEGGPAMAYAHSVWNYPKFGVQKDPDKLAAWLLAADPKQRDIFLRGMKDLEEELGAAQEASPADAAVIATRLRRVLGDNELGDEIDKITGLATLGTAFAPAKAGWETSSPLGDGKAHSVPDIIALGDTPENYAAYAEAAKTQMPDYARQIEFLNGKTKQERMKALDNAYDAYDAARTAKVPDPADVERAAKNLEAVHLGHAFHTALALAELVSPDPKAGAAEKRLSSLAKRSQDPVLQEARSRLDRLSRSLR